MKTGVKENRIGLPEDTADCRAVAEMEYEPEKASGLLKRWFRQDDVR